MWMFCCSSNSFEDAELADDMLTMCDSVPGELLPSSISGGSYATFVYARQYGRSYSRPERTSNVFRHRSMVLREDDKRAPRSAMPSILRAAIGLCSRNVRYDSEDFADFAPFYQLHRTIDASCRCSGHDPNKANRPTSLRKRVSPSKSGALLWHASPYTSSMVFGFEPSRRRSKNRRSLTFSIGMPFIASARGSSMRFQISDQTSLAGLPRPVTSRLNQLQYLNQMRRPCVHLGCLCGPSTSM